MGVPSIRYNSFVGKIGVMNVLEDDYGLSVGIPAGQEEELLETIERVVKDREYKSTIQKRLEIMNESMVDVNQMVLDYLESKGYYKSNS
jgi:predicted glycosyltransferase